MGRYSRIAKNARLGDGCVVHRSKNAYIGFMSTDLKLLHLKRDLCDLEGITYKKIGTQKSGYGGKKTIYNFFTPVSELITEVAEASLEDLIADIDKTDLFLWYMDDGSWHISRNTMHLYSNMLNESQTNLLISKIESLYGFSPRIRTDRKKDGRSFYYLYFTRDLVKAFRPEFKEFAISNELTSMYYKFGGLDYKEAV